MSANDHGSASTYTYHACRCAECREAHRVRVAARRLARRAEGIPESVVHGRASTYQNWSCRCDPCREANRPSRHPGRLQRIRAIAEELTQQRDWLANGHRASDYGHDLLIALGNPDLKDSTNQAAS